MVQLNAKTSDSICNHSTLRNAALPVIPSAIVSSASGSRQFVTSPARNTSTPSSVNIPNVPKAGLPLKDIISRPKKTNKTVKKAAVKDKNAAVKDENEKSKQSVKEPVKKVQQKEVAKKSTDKDQLKPSEPKGKDSNPSAVIKNPEPVNPATKSAGAVKELEKIKDTRRASDPVVHSMSTRNSSGSAK